MRLPVRGHKEQRKTSDCSLLPSVKPKTESFSLILLHLIAKLTQKHWMVLSSGKGVLREKWQSHQQFSDTLDSGAPTANIYFS
jgi:hypothetical protein